jgi:VCBS repeat-containing protein
VDADGNISYDPREAAQLQQLAKGEFKVDSFSYTIEDLAGATSTATVKVTVAGENDGPTAIRVLVVGATVSINDGVVAQLNDSLQFDLRAESTLISGAQDFAFWRGQFVNYDVVVIGEDGASPFELEGTPIFAALSAFLDDGGGVITTGLFATYAFAGDTVNAEKISPTLLPALNGTLAVGNGSLITAAVSLDPAVQANIQAIMGGLPGYAAQGNHEVAAAVDVFSGAQVVATDGQGRVAIAYDEVGTLGGRTVYLGSLHMGLGSIGGDAARQTSDDPANQFDVDQIFERAVAWAAGGSASAPIVSSLESDFAATDTLAFATPPVDATLI